eukprot:TRINITY_DN2500_c0_g1_i2.p1 TRINITY_DN2500_c0_g1~~TRINITY_DN2500_c0_g1_i2.p1  ORF type:complete len:1139 (+),score=219.87 TRINITY_DN2500_c0_g1_i2:255-3671(+)
MPQATPGSRLQETLLLGILVLGCCLFSLAYGEDGFDDIMSIDVTEGQDAVLNCRFLSQFLNNGTSTYWIRKNRNGYDNVAIGQTPYEHQYRVQLSDDGTYNLRIINATYDRDNGDFECRMKKGGSGKTLHSKSVKLTVLLEPSQPKITLESNSVTEDQPTNLTCSSIGGSPPPTMKWFRKGDTNPLQALSIPGDNKDLPTKSILTIKPTKEDDDSSYKCTIWNRALKENEKLHTSTKIHVNYFPRVTVGPENPLKVEKDETASLECNVDSKPRVNSVKWTREGRFINTDFKHTIPRVSLSDAGSYLCSADNDLGRVGESELKLDVLYAPVFNLSRNVEASEGEEVNIECSVSSNPRPSSIQWYKKGEKEFLRNGRILTLKSISASNEGEYVCSATNRIQPTGKPEYSRTRNASIIVNVRHKPGKAFILPEKPIAVEGKSIKLTCGANPPGFPTPRYTWFKDGSQIPSGTGRNPDFIIGSADLNNAGKYECRPANELGSGTLAEVNLLVYQAPKIRTPLQPTIMKRARDTGFQSTCSAVGKPKPKVHWFKDGREITEDSEFANLYEITTSEQVTLQNVAVYVLSTLKFLGSERISENQLMPTDRGHYTCQFDNDVARTETTMLLRIEHSPIVVHRHNKVASDIGQAAIIRCRMQAYPAPRFDWSFGNSILQSEVYERNVTSLDDDIYEGVLRIFPVTESNYGEYSCKGVNTMGAQKTIIKLQPTGKPEKSTNLRAVDQGFDYITLTWDEGFDGGYNDTMYIVQYRKKGVDSAPKYEDCLSHPCNLTKVEQNSAYLVRVKASNIRGESKYSSEILVRTEVDVSKIPAAEGVHFERSTSTTSFNIGSDSEDYAPLIAQVELENPDGTWKFYDQFSLKQSKNGLLKIEEEVVHHVRVRLCLESEAILCGPYTDAKMVNVLESASDLSSGQGAWVIGVIVFIILLGIGTLLLIIKCCCCGPKKNRKPNDKVTVRPNIIHNAQPPPYSFENKGVDTLKDADEVAMKNNLVYNPNQNGYEQEYPEQSNNSNSANGGSVNSQDSLWNVKNNAGGGVDNYMGHPGTSQGQAHIYGYEPAVQQVPPQGYQVQIPGNPDYTHYPYPDEYLNERNRHYLQADPYANPRQNPQQRIESDCKLIITSQDESK